MNESFNEMMDVIIYLCTFAAAVVLPITAYFAHLWRKEVLVLREDLAKAHRKIQILSPSQPSRMSPGTLRELERQRRKHENHEMMRRGSFPQKARSSKKGRR